MLKILLILRRFSEGKKVSTGVHLTERLLTFAVKLSHFVTEENNVINTKWPSLIVKNGKMSILQRKS
jgi:hypothetical protein